MPSSLLIFARGGVHSRDWCIENVLVHSYSTIIMIHLMLSMIIAKKIYIDEESLQYALMLADFCI
jgi:hypothetical protein